MNAAKLIQNPVLFMLLFCFMATPVLRAEEADQAFVTELYIRVLDSSVRDISPKDLVFSYLNGDQPAEIKPGFSPEAQLFYRCELAPGTYEIRGVGDKMFTINLLPGYRTVFLISEKTELDPPVSWDWSGGDYWLKYGAYEDHVEIDRLLSIISSKTNTELSSPPQSGNFIVQLAKKPLIYQSSDSAHESLREAVCSNKIKAMYYYTYQGATGVSPVIVYQTKEDF